MMWFIVIIALTNVLWQVGGQFFKGARRYMIPGMAMISSMGICYVRKKQKKEYLKALGFLFMILILSMGYGEDSKLSKLCGGRDWLIRCVYALLLSAPFALYGAKIFLISLAVLTGAFQIRAGVLFKWGPNKKYDWLIEDTFRATALGLSIWLAIMR